MGNAPAKRGGTTTIEVNSIKDKIQPLAVFCLDDLNREELMEFMSHPNLLMRRYKELLRKHHPDHGGSQMKCAIINYCYETLHEAQQNMRLHVEERRPERTDEELRSEYKEQKKYDEKEVKKAVQSLMKSEDFSKKFNEAFELAKMKDYTDDGYDEGPRTTSTKREPIAVKRINGINSSNINELFESNTKVNQQLIVREKKEPEGICSLKHAVYEYGKKKESDFGRMTQGAADYGIAFAGERLIDFESARPKDKDLHSKVTLDAAKRARETQNLDHTMTEEERDIWAEEEERKEREELERKAHMTEMDYEAGKRQNIFIERMLNFTPN